MVVACRPSDQKSEQKEDEGIVFDVLSFIDKSPEGVTQLLGKPDTTYQRTVSGKRYFVQYYNEHHTEVMHLQGKVVGIILNEPHPLKFTPETITKFGISYREPTMYEPRSTIMWKNIEGIKVANMYLVGTPRVDSIEHNFRIYFNLEDNP